MPIKWTAEVDQVVSPLAFVTLLTITDALLNSSYSKSSRRPTSTPTSKLFLKHGVSTTIWSRLSKASLLDLNNSTTATNMEKPTPRAISERLVKIRNTAKTAGTSTHFSVKKPATPAGTPRKRAPAGSANGAKKATPKKNGTKANGQASRKRGRKSSDEWVHVILASARTNLLLVTNPEAMDSSLTATTPMPLMTRRVRLRRPRQSVRPLLNLRRTTRWRVERRRAKGFLWRRLPYLPKDGERAKERFQGIRRFLQRCGGR